MNDHAAPEEAAEDGGPVEESRDPAGKRHGGAPDDPPPAPRGIDGESRVVAERSGADATFPDRPLPADLPPDDLGGPRRRPRSRYGRTGGRGGGIGQAGARAGDGAGLVAAPRPTGPASWRNRGPRERSGSQGEDSRADR
ncbi:hypothetical protein GCM10018953_32590 [Streptosporangium nondiastaticum]